MERLMGLAGMVAFIAFAYALSHNRKAIHLSLIHISEPTRPY